MKEELKNIKELLFDAPIEVKKAFNQVVEYFAMPKNYYVAVRDGKVIRREVDRKALEDWKSSQSKLGKGDYSKVEIMSNQQAKSKGIIL